MGIGELAAAAAAFCWACSSVIYGRTRLNAWTINFAKNLFGLGFVTLHLIALWMLGENGLFSFSASAWMYLAISGIVGIAIGDTFYFRSLQILGPRRSLVVSTSTPIFGAIIGWWMLDEFVPWWSLVGILITITGIAVVVLDKQARKESPGHFPGSEWIGVGCGLVAAICQASGGAISKMAMEECSALEATFVRLLAAVVIGIISLPFLRRLKLSLIFEKSNLQLLLPAAALGTWLGIWCSQIGFYFTSVAIATMLMSTSPLFAIPLVRFFDGHRISSRAIWGTLIALFGIAMALHFSTL